MDGVGGKGQRWASMGRLMVRLGGAYQEYYQYDIGHFRYDYRINFDDTPTMTFRATFQDEFGRRKAKRRIFQEHAMTAGLRKG